MKLNCSFIYNGMRLAKGQYLKQQYHAHPIACTRRNSLVRPVFQNHRFLRKNLNTHERSVPPLSRGFRLPRVRAHQTRTILNTLPYAI